MTRRLVALTVILFLLLVGCAGTVSLLRAVGEPIPWQTFSGMAKDVKTGSIAGCPKGAVYIAYFEKDGDRYVLIVEGETGENRWGLARVRKGQGDIDYVWYGQQEADTASDPQRHDRIVPRVEHRYVSERDNDVCAVLYAPRA